MNLRKISRYWNTIRYLKLSQIYHRLRKMARLSCTIGTTPRKDYNCIIPLQTVPVLDFDTVFLARFPINETMEDKITLLHEWETFHWNGPWNFPNHTALWNYNLHYFEYLFPIVKAYKDTGDSRYLDKIKAVLGAWIKGNPRGARPGWEPYPIALRLTNWFSIYTHLESDFAADPQFQKDLIRSIWEQYDFLAHRLEKDLLGNHYFEDLKALILCSLFFGDEKMLQKSLAAFRKQCCEQILSDGMHFELSPMYHKLILEDVMRVATALRGAGKRDAEIESYLQSMLDVAYSLEEGLDRIPLFNDCGNNVAKSLAALCEAAKAHFDLTPKYKDKLPDSGYYIFKQGDWKLIVDAGQPGPAYLPGHAHCDAMSFELFRSGKPVIVNCGTYAYQCDERAFFRSTAAHNTVQVDGVEQSECWGAFRMGRRSRTRVKAIGEDYIEMEMIDQKGTPATRRISLTNNTLLISDSSNNGMILSYIHLLRPDVCDIVLDSTQEKNEQFYAEEFGKHEIVAALGMFGKGQIYTKAQLH